MPDNKPWLDEPDFYQWVHKGIQCTIIRHASLLHLCGYVTVQESNRYSAMDEFELNQFKSFPGAHGGITYRGRTLLTEPQLVYDTSIVFGFDCAHSNDISPGNGYFPSHAVYRNFDYVKAEVEQLAEFFATGEKN